MRPTSRPLFESLVAPLPGPVQAVSWRPPNWPGCQKIGSRSSKYLPRSYRESFVFTGPRATGAITDDSYHCAIKDNTKPNPAFVVSPDTVSWGEVYAYCLGSRDSPCASAWCAKRPSRWLTICSPTADGCMSTSRREVPTRPRHKRSSVSSPGMPRASRR